MEENHKNIKSKFTVFDGSKLETSKWAVPYYHTSHLNSFLIFSYL
jgi:hypothetical protein